VIPSSDWLGRPAAAIDNPAGRGPFVLVCDHASNWVPAKLHQLGLPDSQLQRHIAWDPGALALALQLGRLLDAPLVHASVSRLVLDVNRDPGHAGSIVESSEDTAIPGNRGIDPAERARRVSAIYEPYHRVLAEVVERQAALHANLHVIAVHSFTPVFRGQQRPWHVGILAAADRRMAQPLIELLRQSGDLVVGDNQPYAPTDGVYHTLERHCSARNLRSVMIELRADLIETDDARSRWADRLARALRSIG